MRVLICEDAVLLREGLVRLLEDAGHEVVAALGDASGLADTVTELDPQLVLLDVRLPPSWTNEGVRAALELRRADPGRCVLVDELVLRDGAGLEEGRIDRVRAARQELAARRAARGAGSGRR